MSSKPFDQIGRRYELSSKRYQIAHFLYEKAGQKLTVTANYMTVQNRNDQDANQKGQLRFVEAINPTYEKVLVLQGFSSAARKRFFALPVEGAEHKGKSLPGAPLAYLEDDDKVIDDTDAIDYDQTAIPPNIIKDLRTWFETNHFKSFASLVLREPDKNRPIGVLNIEVNQKNIFGTTQEGVQVIQNLLRPLQTALEIILTVDPARKTT